MSHGSVVFSTTYRIQFPISNNSASWPNVYPATLPRRDPGFDTGAKRKFTNYRPSLVCSNDHAAVYLLGRAQSQIRRLSHNATPREGDFSLYRKYAPYGEALSMCCSPLYSVKNRALKNFVNASRRYSVKNRPLRTPRPLRGAEHCRSIV